jgi:peptide/nickel transport system substrate-binding protein
LLALKSAQLDVYDNIPANEFSQLTQDQRMQEKYNFYTPETYDFSFIGINSRLEKFADKRTRQAIAHLLDIDQIIKVTQKQYATRTIGPVKPGDINYNSSVNLFPYNPSKAIELLKQAGWQQQNGKWVKRIKKQLTPLTITVLYKAGNTTNENTAFIFRQAAAQIVFL